MSRRIVTSPGNDTFIDGPQWVDSNGGFLVYSEFAGTERMLRVNIDGGGAGTFRTAGFDNQLGPIGNGVRNGLILTAASGKNAGAGTSSFFLSLPDGGPAGTISVGAASSPNDMAVTKTGAIFFTDPRYQDPGNPTGVYKTGVDGGGAVIVDTFNGGETPNGIALSPDGTKLYVSFTQPKRIDMYPVNAAGNLGARVNIVAPADLPDAPDGIAVDIGGNLWVAAADENDNNNGRVEVFQPGATAAATKKWGQIPFPTTRPTGVAFGGADNKTLFITVETRGGAAAPSGVFVYQSRCAGVR